MKRVACLALALISAAGCGEPSTAERRTGGAESTPPPELDVGAIAQRVHFAFRDEGALFTSEHETHAVAVHGATIQLTPVRPADPATTDPTPVPRAAAAVALAAPTPPLTGAPLTLTTRSVSRDALLASGATASVDDQGRLVRPGAGYTEILQNAEAGVELSWAFDERPAGEADLEVRVQASGLEHVADTDGGIHFRDPVSTLGVRFGHATWVDAAGARTAVRVEREGEDLVMRVPAELVDRSSFPAVLDPVIGPEIGVDAPIPGAPSGYQYEHSIAFDGSGYFVAWNDQRSGSTAEIVGTRVSAAGVVLDPQGIVITSTGGANPSVVFDGTDYLVVWANGPVSGQRVSTAGALVGARITIASNGSGGSAVHAAGTTFVVFVRYDTGMYRLELVRLSGTTVLDPTPIVLASRSNGLQSPRAALGGGTLLVTWYEYNGSEYDVYAARASTAGVALDAAAIGVATGAGYQYAAWAASDGTNFLVAYYDDGVIRARTIASATGALGAAVQVGFGSDPSVAFVVDHYRTITASGNVLRGNRVTPAGVVLDSSSGTVLATITGQSISQARVIAAGAGAYVVWGSMPSPDGYERDLHGSRLTAAGVVTDAPGVRLSTWSNGQRFPALASNGTDFLAVWHDDRDGVAAIYGARVSGATGMPLDTPALLISAGGRYEQSAGVAWNGTHWLVVWYDGRSGSAIYGARVSAAGVLMDPTGLVLVGSPAGIYSNQIDVASDGAGWLVVWADYRASSYAIYGMRVSAAGAPLDVAGGFAIGTGANYRSYPHVAHGLGRYIVAWTDYRSGSVYDVYASRVTSAGAVQDPAGIAIESSPTSVSSQTVDVGASATDLLVAYSQSTTRVARVSPSTGAVVGDTSVGSSSYYLALASGDGVGQLLGGISTTLRLTRFDATGTDIDVPDVTVSTTAASYRPVAIDTVPGRTLIAYSTYDATPGVTALRVVTRTVDRDPLGTTCTSDLQCESGSCVDGVCCNSACGGGATNDCQACSVAAGAATNGTCGPRTMGATCRGATGICDAPEVCDGASLACPSDAFATPTTVCRVATGTCDVAEMCTGTSATCPTNGVAAMGTECRAASGLCDVAEVCDGASTGCPANGYATGGTTCRASAGICDVAEECSGSSPACPADAFASAATTCRGSAGVCDVAEMCTGSAAACPADVFASAATSCRGSAGPCDVAEMCTGSSAACPGDAFASAATECRASAGDCDVAETCTGSGAACPGDAFASAATECRAAAGVCDVAETCTGSGAACPSDAARPPGVACGGAPSGVCDAQDVCSGTVGATATCEARFAASSTECRASAGDCDVAETCTGTSTTCPGDAFASASTTCRASIGECDAAEACTGSSAACPADAAQAPGTACGGAPSGVCDAQDVCAGAIGATATCDPRFASAATTCRPPAGDCDVAETCTGSDTACPGDAFASAATICRGAAGVCDVEEACTGSDPACPSDAFASPATVCRGSAGVCDVEETCTGAGAACPSDAFASTATICRASGGVCDVEEACTGSGAACPSDAFASASTVCRGAAGDCDVEETCSGSGVACPSDGFLAAATVCRAATDVCDVDEACSGSDAACPTDGFASAATVCRAAIGECDAEETCSGASAPCPSDAAQPEGTACGGAPSGDCDAQDVCAGTVGASAACDPRYLPATTECRAASCVTGVETLAATCTGADQTCPTPTTGACSPFACGADACLSGCAGDGDCAPGHYCDAGACVPHADLGNACAADVECASGHCVDGVCCDTACTGQCEACGVAGTEGFCSPVTGAPVGGRAACATDGGACGGACDGVVRDACGYPDVTTVCRAGSCAAGVAILEAGCDGAGACPAETTQVCAPFLCGDTTCDGDCVTDDDCDAGAFCAAGMCSAQLDDGGACDRARQCGSGECVDGVCCESACDGQCEACDVAGSEGVCSAVTGAPHGARAACASDGSGCGGACDGAERAACIFPDATVSCGEATCADGTATAAGACDAAGSCDAGGSTECAPFACGETACLDECADDEDCAGGFACAGGECVAVSPDGGVVDGDGGVGDAGIDADGGELPASPGAGCGCAVPGGSTRTPATVLLLGVLGLTWLARRRRRSLRAE